ncbi:MAG: hypothetical protein BGO78_10915 [Chloroflexi bacterium 44-23]|nr:MAG: hypothetical protein BGO78_10915 [Chloroflexi bacterium 44-23]
MVDFDSLFARLRAVNQFQSLKDKDLRHILDGGHLQNYSAGEMIFVQDEPCSGMFVLISGRVNLCKLGPQGQENILATIEPVIMFNEVTVLDGGKNPVTAFATQESVIWKISCEKFQHLLEQYSAIGISLLRVLAARNRRLIEHYEDLSYRNVESRVAKLLLDLSHNGSRDIVRRDHPIEEMASLIATVGPVISRTLKSFKEKGWIQSSRISISVLDAEELARLARMNLSFLG